MLAPPGHGVSRETPDPDSQRHHIARRQQPQITQHLPVAQHSYTDGQGQRHPRQQRQAKQRNTAEAGPRGNQVAQRPRQPIGKHHPGISQLPGKTRAAAPANLVRQELTKSILRQKSLNHLAAQEQLKSTPPNPRSQLVIIRQVVNQRLQAADSLQRLARNRQRRAQAKTNSVFNLPCRQDTGNKVSSYPQRLHARPDRLVRLTPVERRDQPYLATAPLGHLETTHDSPQVQGRNLNVTVVDQNIFVLRATQHLHQVTHLAVSAQQLWAQHQTDRSLRELRLQPFNSRYRRISHAADLKQNLVRTLILLHAVAGKAGIHFRVQPLDRFQYADAGLKVRQRPP